MTNITAILIDDESSSRNSLRQKLQTYCPYIQIIAECENGEEGIKAIQSSSPDIVFLDVEMPRMNGFVMLQHLEQRSFELIFTTAYDHYAIRALRESALDYLVKPIEIKLLLEAVERVRTKKENNTPNQRIEILLHNLLDNRSSHRIAILSLEGLQFIELSDIIFVEAESNYSFITLQSGPKITVSKTLKDFEELLTPALFIRIHHSYIINKDHIKKYLKGDGGQVLMSNGKLLDVARRKKDDFLKAISQ